MDDSLVDAFDQAFVSGACVLNFSRILAEICDPLNDYFVPESIIGKIKEGLVRHDQVLVLAANNESSDLSYLKEQVYFKQFSHIPDIASRMLIVVNVSYSKDKGDYQLYFSSNWPGKDLGEYTVSAIGADVISGYAHQGEKLFEAVSGTSQAAPKVSGLCVLTKQYYQDKGKSITAPEIVNIVKKTAQSLGDPEKYGHDLIDPKKILSHQ